MAFKTITIKEEVYDKIKRAKRKNESFSELFDRTIEVDVEDRMNQIMKYAGIWKMTDKEYKKKIKDIYDAREASIEESEKRMKRLWGKK